MKVLPVTSDNLDKKPIVNKEKNVKVYNIIKFVKQKFPSFLLFIHICISKHLFVCEINYHSQINSTSVDRIVVTDNHINKNIFIMYLIIMSIICILWESLYKYFRYKKKQQLVTTLTKWYFILCSLVSLLAFLSTIFYIDDNHVFDCFIDYNKTVANLVFYMSYLIIIIMSIIENYINPANLKPENDS